MRAPIDDQSLHLILMGFLTSNSRLENNFASATPVHYPSHIFSSMQLAKISDLPTKVDCECPHHLADLLESLKEFERYSGECINKNDEDAALHGKIQITTAGARHQLEMLLQEVLTIEGIRI